MRNNSRICVSDEDIKEYLFKHYSLEHIWSMIGWSEHCLENWVEKKHLYMSIMNNFYEGREAKKALERDMRLLKEVERVLRVTEAI